MNRHKHKYFYHQMHPIPPFEAETFKVFWVSCPPTPQEGRGLWPLPPTTQLILPTTKKHFYMLELLWKLAEFRYCKPNTAISL